MQDIAGCRAVVSNVADVYRLVKAYQKGATGKWLHTLVGAGKDYIENPKPDGYRSIHLIFRYVGTPPNHSWDRLRVEMQIRSQHQHAWATALEAVDIFTRQALKANQGDKDWQRFFALMGTAIALKEGSPPVPNTPTTPAELRDELRHLEQSLGASHRLEHFRHAIRESDKVVSADKQAAYYLLHLSFNERTVSWETFRWGQSQEANAKYTELEQKVAGNPDEHVVLVRAASVAAMKRAYPSFFLDAELFLRLVGEALGPIPVWVSGSGAA